MDRDVIRVAQEVADVLVGQLLAAERDQQDSDSFANAVAVALDEAMAHLSETDLWGPDNRMASNEFWRIAEPWLRHGDLQWHARSKPRGYAGDYELLRKICEQICCRHPIGWAMDRYFLSQAAPRAVRYRMRLVQERIVRLCVSRGPQPVHLVSIGSGPALEIQQAAAQLPAATRQRLEVTLIDLDQQALDFACQQLAGSLAPGSVSARRTNLARLAGNRHVRSAISEADYLYCPGFFDYLCDDDAIELLSFFFDCLAPGGELTIFNFARGNASRAYMEWIGNWYLTYRDTSDMRSLAQAREVDAAMRVSSISDDTLLELTLVRGQGPER